jgi:hypothetical protein
MRLPYQVSLQFVISHPIRVIPHPVVTSLVTLPVRVGLRAANLTVQVTQAAAERAIEVVGQVVTSRPSRRSGPDRQERSEGQPHSDQEGRRGNGRAEAPVDPRSAAVRNPPPQVAPEPPAEVPAEDRRPEPDAGQEPAPPVPPAPEPDHVSEEADLVEEVAEPGAEDGAGANVHIEEPWDGYRELHAEEIIDRLSSAGAAELAAVELYERAHRNRQTVLEAAEREFRRQQNESH